MIKRINTKYLKKIPFSISLAIVVIVFAVIGGTYYYLTKAATPTTNLEAESATRTGNATIVNDAAASGGKALQFNAGSTSPPPSSGINCTPKPSACGYPDATNTGPAAGTVFKRVPQDITSGTGWVWEPNFTRIRVTGNGAILDSLNISGQVVIDATNVILSNSIVTFCDTEGDIVVIRAGNSGNGYNGNSPIIKNNRLTCNQPTTNRARSGIRDIYGAARNVQAIANDISGAGNGITLEYEGVARDNWIHDLGHLSGDHHSGVSTHGGALSIVYEHNTLLLANTSTSGGGGLSGAITSYGDFAHAQNMTARNNFVSGGAYTVYGGINNEDKYGNPTNIKFLNNRFVCGSWVYGPAFVRSGPTNEFTGNFCDSNLAAVNP